ncbi:hypothetical protein BaRGS_00033195 [Batillaria attramentaria]|uniref:Uncharacterized protein n=1 Tax=Batillaria attramentaria TaxID=370345 RepID=A0ABD0JM68_9CAEN
MECRPIIILSIRLLLFFVASFMDTTKAGYTAGIWMPAGTKCFFFSKQYSVDPWRDWERFCGYAYMGAKMAEPTSQAEMSFLGEAGNAVYGASYIRWAIGVKVNKETESLYYLSGQNHSFVKGLMQYWRGLPLSVIHSQRSCVFLENKKILDADCYLAYYYICEKSLPKSCSSSPCRNGGKCTENCFGYECICGGDRYGLRCDLQISQCASRPCQNNGRCTDLILGYKCACTEATAGVNCEQAIRNEVYYNCSAWLPEGQSITCECSDTGIDASHLVGWNLFGNDTDLRPTIFFESLKRNANLTSYICQATLTLPDSAERLVKRSVYLPRIAYGPTINDTTITGPETVAVDEIPVYLECFSNDVEPYAVAHWVGVQCLHGNSLQSCTFVPNPTSALQNGTLRVQCTLTNGEAPQFRVSLTHSIRVEWSGRARVLYLAVEGVENVFATNTTNQRLTLVCAALGRPLPTTLDVYLVAGRNSSATQGGDKLRPTKSSNTSEYRLLKEYIVRSPAACQAVDTYRCETSNTDEPATDMLYMTVVTNCTRPSSAKSATSPAVIAGSFVGSLGALAGVALTVYNLRRQKKQAAQRRTDRMSAQVHSLMFTEHMQDATHIAEAEHERDMKLEKQTEELAKGYEYVSENHDDSMLEESSATITTYDSGMLDASSADPISAAPTAGPITAAPSTAL